MYRLRLPFVSAILLAVLATGCKENTLIDSRLSPTDNELGVFDTSLPVISHTYYDDTAITSYYVAGLNLFQGVGSVTDPFFGTMTGTTHFQVLPINKSIALYDNKTIDSAVLILPYSGYTYGDSANTDISQTYQAFFLNEGIEANSIYYSYTTRGIDISRPLSEPTTVKLHSLKDSQMVNGINYHPGLRLRLNLETLNSRLLPALTAITGNDDPANFHNIFKGVCVKVADSRESTTAYPYFRLNGTDDYSGAGILVYYHTNGASDTLSERYFFDGSNCGFFNNVSRSNGHSPVSKLLASSSDNDSIIAIQNQPGPGLDIVIPGLSSLPEGVIVKAQLQLPLLPGHIDERFRSVTRMYPLRISNGIYPAGTDAGSAYQVSDRYPLTDTSAFFVMDGRVRTIKRDGTDVSSYIIGLPREIASCIAAKNDTLHLRINGTQDFVGAFRSVLGGGNHPNPLYKAKLFVVYSRLNK